MKDLKDLYIIGAGGFGREVAWLVERINEKQATWNLKGFIDDNQEIWGTKEDGYLVYGGCNYLKSLNNIYAVCAVGSARIRKKIIKKFSDSQVKFATVIDPSVILSDKVEIGEGTIICAGTIITVDVKIGKHVIINLDCTIGHDDLIHDFVTIYPSVNVSGMVDIGERSELGTGTQIIQGKTIATNTIIGAGAVVINDCVESGTYVGSPAKIVKDRGNNVHNEKGKNSMDS
jgi:sugar O-acyltransferase (sialic acid O-acetyltransferase NeuD family)